MRNPYAAYISFTIYKNPPAVSEQKARICCRGTVIITLLAHNISDHTYAAVFILISVFRSLYFLFFALEFFAVLAGGVFGAVLAELIIFSAALAYIIGQIVLRNIVTGEVVRVFVAFVKRALQVYGRHGAEPCVDILRCAVQGNVCGV